MKKRFWKDWKNKTKIEINAIKSIQEAQKVLFKEILKERIVAIYVKGSFVRREMNTKSDVDIIPIVKDNQSLKKIQALEQTRGYLYKPAELLPHSLKEFEQGKRYLKYKQPKGNVDGTLRELHRYKLIYGKPIDITYYKIRSDVDFLKDHTIAFRKIFIPLYNAGKFGFSELMKQVFFLTEKEERVKGKESPETWQSLVKSIKHKDHIVNEAYKYRMDPTKDPRIRRKLLRKLEKHLSKIEEKYFQS